MSSKGIMDVDWVLSILIFFTIVMFMYFYVSHIFSSSIWGSLESVWESGREKVLMNLGEKAYIYNLSSSCPMAVVEYETIRESAFGGNCFSYMQYTNQSHYYSYHFYLANTTNCIISLNISQDYLDPSISLGSGNIGNNVLNIYYNNTCITQIKKGIKEYLDKPICFNNLEEIRRLSYGGVINYGNSSFIFIPPNSEYLIFTSNTTRDWDLYFVKGFDRYYDSFINSTISSYHFYSSPEPVTPFLSIYNTTSSITIAHSKSLDAYNESGVIHLRIKNSNIFYIYFGDGYTQKEYECIEGWRSRGYGMSAYIIKTPLENITLENYKYMIKIPSLNISTGYSLPVSGDVYSNAFYAHVLDENLSLNYTKVVLAIWR